jgi:hypothetical protein
MIQKTEVNEQISFRTPARQQAGIVADIQEMAPVITELIRKWKFNPNAKPSNKYEKKAMRTLSKLRNLVAQFPIVDYKPASLPPTEKAKPR